MSFGLQGIGSTSSSSSAATTQASSSLQPFANLNLTESQRTQIRSILNSAKSGNISQSDMQTQINGVLTTTQQQLLQSDIASVQGQQAQSQTQSQTNWWQQGPFANLNLTSAQQSQIQTILQNAKSSGTTNATTVNSQIEAVLSSTQKTAFESNLATMKSSGHSGHHHGGGGSASSTSSSDTDAWGVSESSNGSSSSSATVNGQTVQDLQNQVLAAYGIQMQQYPYEFGLASSNTTSSGGTGS